MEFWDALEDSQFLDAVASVRDGPRPICKWATPKTSEDLQDWERRVKARKTPTCQPQSSGESDEDIASVEPLTLDWYVSCPIGLYFFSSFVKDQPKYAAKSRQEQQPATDNTVNAGSATRKTSEQTDKLAYIRMNFLEDLLRYQKMVQEIKADNRPRKAQHFEEQLLEYIQPPKRDEENGDLVLPKMTQIREFDLHMRRCSSERRLGFQSRAEIEAALTTNHDDTYETNLVGLKGPLLEELRAALEEWMRQNSKYYNGKSQPHSNNTTEESKQEETKNVTLEDLVKDESSALIVTVKTEASVSSSSSHHPDNNEVEEDNDANNNGSRTRTNSNDRLVSVLLPIIQKVEVIVYESLKRDYDGVFRTGSSPEYCRMRNFLWYQDRRVVFDDFYIMRVLGRGGFGLVSACQKGTTGKLYAIKVMSKKRIKTKKSVQFVMNERRALAAVAESPFIINLKYSLHSEDEIYLVLDIMVGGDLGWHLRQRRKGFSNNQCLYYAARIMLGLQALHDQHYVYRDLKPENCLLSEDGRVKITDLGLATKTSPNLPSGVVGTRGYWAPEMHQRDEAGKRVQYNHSVDWFSFGCCITEFICGRNPFRSEARSFGKERGEENKDKAIDLAIREMEPEFKPELFEPDAADLCRRLLDKDPTTRLGSNGGSSEIMAHPWFKTVDWEMIQTDRAKPPFTPPKDVNAASQHEIGNFADDNSKSSRSITFDESDERVYRDWDWINPKAYATEVIEFLVHERDLGRPLLPDSLNSDLCCCCIVM